MTATVHAMDVTASGVECSQSVEKAFGQRLEILESDWRLTLTPKETSLWDGFSSGIFILLGAWIFALLIGGLILRRRLLARREEKTHA
jgi:hypothetical protein